MAKTTPTERMDTTELTAGMNEGERAATPKAHHFVPRHSWTSDTMGDWEWDPADPQTRERMRGPTLKSDGTLADRCEP